MIFYFKIETKLKKIKTPKEANMNNFQSPQIDPDQYQAFLKF